MTIQARGFWEHGPGSANGLSAPACSPDRARAGSSEPAPRPRRHRFAANWARRADAQWECAANGKGVRLRHFLAATALNVEHVYDARLGWSDLCADAGLTLLPPGRLEGALRRGCCTWMTLSSSPQGPRGSQGPRRPIRIECPSATIGCSGCSSRPCHRRACRPPPRSPTVRAVGGDAVRDAEHGRSGAPLPWAGFVD